MNKRQRQAAWLFIGAGAVATVAGLGAIVATVLCDAFTYFC